MKFSLSVLGSAQVLSRLTQVANAIQGDAVQQGLLAAAAHIAQAAEAEAPVDDGVLKRGMRSGPLPGVKVGAYAGSTAPHSHLVEFGTVERHHKSGKGVGIMPANPFFERAINRSRAAAGEIAISGIIRGYRR